MRDLFSVQDIFPHVCISLQDIFSLEINLQDFFSEITHTPLRNQTVGPL